MQIRKLLTALAILPMLTLTGCATIESNQAQPVIAEISNAWVRASDFSDHQGGMTGVFMEITNPGTEPITLVGGSSEISSTVEIHEVVMKDDALVMQPKVGGITIQPGETHVLEMGGDHVMLMDLKKAIMAGDLITVSLDFEGAEDVTLEGLVAKTSDGGDEEYNHGEEGHSH